MRPSGVISRASARPACQPSPHWLRLGLVDSNQSRTGRPARSRATAPQTLPFPILAKNGSETVGDFAYGRVAIGGIDDRWHQVGARAGSPLQRGEALFHGRLAARRAHFAQFPDLRVLQRGVQSEGGRSEEHTSELQSRQYLVCRLLL